ncbi:bifunctional histidinol-phosphatase/imidazoleglycerol-phosphate dehydratase HisB [Thermomonas sp.]|uniref:bifunctional histidinol-phosphatase/imidazoleglycerol-phosphate dehydratase HisB n=1 Tax=Thermomonas sp. TaxID=1971895 RepID=UPI0026296A6C|nr:bifunctional histidinol-phosphatase/imidazoleglycerol-phosphate dehydratase HisB [Thermomonas sp.]MBL0229110.1 bifunctional histidinol-phosphatase/imidazoleglycerol-phosphate dehydratase HisB [Thermomonas sp.]
MSAPVPILFVDRDGTLITEPDDFQIDAFEKLRFVDGVIPAMLRLRDAGWQFVMVTNQDGLGTDAFPQAAFDGPHALMLQVFASQGITFREVLVDTSFERDNSPNRKPNTGLVTGLLRDRGVDWTRSAMVGDRETDIRFAENLGIRGFKLRSPQFGDGTDWAAIAHALVAAPRVANVVRKTNETAIEVAVDLDDAAKPDIATGLGFFDHMLEQLGTHGGFALRLRCAGDLHIDEHHTVEDCALALGQALREALGNKRGIGRYGFVLPMDETQASATLDLSGRPYFLFEGSFARERVGDLPTELVPHFFHSLCQSAGITLHLAVRGDNAHHQVEACFKVVARALRIALRREGDALPSSKGVL